MNIETIRLSEAAKTKLVTLKRRTGVQHWNVLCRWAFCISLAEPSPPPFEDIPSDSSVEMSWKVFSGAFPELYLALLRERAHRDGVTLSHENELAYFRLHLHRGISYLSSQVGSLDDLLRLTLTNTQTGAPDS